MSGPRTAERQVDSAVEAYWANRQPDVARNAPWVHRILGVQDGKLRRCWFCGGWAYDADPCHGCSAAVTPGTWQAAA